MGSFRNRLLVLIIGLVIVTQTVTLLAVLARTERNVRARAADQLQAAGAFAQQLIRFRAGQLANGAGVLAADFGFREAVASGDQPTILSAARNHSTRIGADLLMLLDTRGHIMASTASGAEARAPRASLQWMLDQPDDAREEPRFFETGGRSYQFVITPIRAPDVIAWVVMGFAVNESLAQRVREMVGFDATVIASQKGHLVSVASTLSRAQREDLAAQLTRNAALGSVQIQNLGGTEYLVSDRRVDSSWDSVDLVLQQSMYAVLAPYRDVRDALLLIGGIALALAAVIGVFLGRTASRPISELVRAARRIEAGDYETSVAVQGGEEFRSLATTFNAMQTGIAEREARITYQARHDALTGLPNRVYAESRLKDLLAGVEAQDRIALIALDIRNIRTINASLGHHVGDEALREAAKRLRQNTEPSEFVARFGASQFLVLAADCSIERAPLLAEQLAGVTSTAFHLPGVRLDLHVNVGVCVYPDHGQDVEQLLRRVGIALDDADEARGSLSIYRTGRDEEHRRTLSLLTDLRGAIDHDQLSLVYQPKVTMAARSVQSLEALVRWSHPQLGPISPGEFVPLAERMGISRQLTSWVVGAALKQMAQWRAEGLSVDVAVNLSAPDILDPELGEEVIQRLREHAVPPTSLVLEITESAVMRDAPLAARNMRLLQVTGVRFAIDDFGTGYSSLSHLSRLPVDELKIDRSFITNAHMRPEDATIVSSTVELGHSMGLKVVAEGVETVETWNFLKQLGCDFAQGYLISKPLAAGEVPAFVRTANDLLGNSDSTQRQIRALEALSLPKARR